LSAFFYQNGKGITTPLTYVVNFIQIARLAFFLLFRFNEVVFGVAFTIQQVVILVYLLRKWKKERNLYSQVIFNLFSFTEIVGTLLFGILGIYSIKIKKL